MELCIRNMAQARQVLSEISGIAEAWQHGDQPCDYTLDEIEEAHANAAAIVAFAGREFRRMPDPVMHRDIGVFTTANSYLRTLTQALLRSDNLNPRTKKLLDFCAIASSMMSEQIIQIPAHA